MNWVTDQILFYGGMAVAVISLAALAVYLLLFRTGTVRLEAQMEREYGVRKKTDRH